MVLLGWLVRIILFALVLRGLVRLLAGFFQGLQGDDGRRRVEPGARGRRKSVPLARDPVCGTYVVPGSALSTVSRGTTYYFCSEDCRRAFERGRAAPRTA